MEVCSYQISSAYRRATDGIVEWGKLKKRFVKKDLESIAGNKGKAFEKFWVVGVDLAIEASSPTRCTQAYWYFLCCPGFTFVWKKKNNNPISLTSADPLLACWTVQKVEEQGHNTEARWQSHSWDGLAPGKEDQDLEKRNWVFNKYRCQCWDWGWFSKRGQLYVDYWFLNLCNISLLLPPVSLSSLAHVLTSKNWREYGRICSDGHEIELFLMPAFIPIHLDQPH